MFLFDASSLRIRHGVVLIIARARTWDGETCQWIEYCVEGTSLQKVVSIVFHFSPEQHDTAYDHQIPGFDRHRLHGSHRRMYESLVRFVRRWKSVCG